MTQIQKLLDVLQSTHSDVLTIVEGEAIQLRRGDDIRPITKQALSAANWQSIVAEFVAPVTLGALADDAPVNTVLVLRGVDFAVSLTRVNGAGRAEVRVALPAASAPESSTQIAVQESRNEPSVADARPTSVSRLEPTDATLYPSPIDPDAHALMDSLLREQMARGASDLHLRSGDRSLFRVSGEISRTDSGEPLSPELLFAMLYAIMPERNRREFRENNDTDFAYELPNVARFRANAFADRHGPAAVFRSIPSKLVTTEELGISPEVQALCQLTKGLVLVTGPTGSGKSTTLCALIDLVNRTRKDHVVTIEDPIEFVHQSKGCLVTQRQVGVHTMSFKAALRAALREDPDVVLVGELRDLETVGIAIETAETGHLVFGTLHTSTAASTIDRIIDQFSPDRQEQIRVMLSESLKGVISQTLCRKIGGGRVAAMEVLLGTPAVSNLIRESKTFQIPSVMQISRRLGMVTLNDALIDLVERQLVEPKEAYLRAIDKITLTATLKQRGFDMSFAEIDSGHNASGSGAGGSSGGAGRVEPTSSPKPTSTVQNKTPAARPGFGLRR
ncbi:MAG: type IV pilus twitching motility protein PilT [Gemmatimonadaceae bacterium]